MGKEMEEDIEKAGEPKHRGGLGQVWAGFREGQLAEPELCFGKKGRKAVVTVRMEQAGISFQKSKLLGLAEVTASLGSDCQPHHLLDSYLAHAGPGHQRSEVDVQLERKAVAAESVDVIRLALWPQP